MNNQKYMDYNIIIIDDDETTRKQVVEHIKSAANFIGSECVVFECATAYEAWNIWKSNKIHGIITEVYLGDSVTGIDFIQEAKKDSKNGRIPVCILTGNQDPFKLSQYWEHALVFPKPIEEYFWKKMISWLFIIDLFWKCIDGSCQNLNKQDEEWQQTIPNT